MQSRRSTIRRANSPDIGPAPAPSVAFFASEAKYKLAPAASNVCPVGYQALMDEKECREIAPSVCDLGFGEEVHWQDQPGGCLLVTKSASASSSCTVYFNVMVRTNPSGHVSWKICASATTETAEGATILAETGQHLSHVDQKLGASGSQEGPGGAPSPSDTGPSISQTDHTIEPSDSHEGPAGGAQQLPRASPGASPSSWGPRATSLQATLSGTWQTTSQLLQRTSSWVSFHSGRQGSMLRNTLIFSLVLTIAGVVFLAASYYYTPSSQQEDRDARSRGMAGMREDGPLRASISRRQSQNNPFTRHRSSPVALHRVPTTMQQPQQQMTPTQPQRGPNREHDFQRQPSITGQGQGVSPRIPPRDFQAQVSSELCPELVVPEGGECTLQVPWLPVGQLTDTSVHGVSVDNTSGVAVFQVTLYGRAVGGASSWSEGGPTPSISLSPDCSKRLMLSSANGEVIFAFCRDGPQDGGARSLTVHQHTAAHFATLRASSDSGDYTLSISNDWQINFRGRSSMQVVDNKHRLLAIGEPMEHAEGRSVRIGPRVDAGCIVLCMLAMDLLEHESSQHP